MPRTNNRSTTVTESVAKPINETELKSSVQVLANAMRGVYGDGDWDGGLGGVGYYVQYAQYWDAKLSFDASGSTTIKLPFTIVDSLVRVTDIATLVTRIIYVAKNNTLPLTGLDGKTILEINFVRNTKE